MYSIGEVSKLFQLPVSTLRYYDKEGLFLNLQRSSGIRRFEEKDLDALRLIECLKKTGMEIKDIKRFMEWCAEGPSSYPKRRELLEERKNELEQQQKVLERNMALIRFKCWYYEQAIQDGNEERLATLCPDKFPPEIQTLYDRSHKQENTCSGKPVCPPLRK